MPASSRNSRTCWTESARHKLANMEVHRMADIILHQYATSPFSEKVRLLLGAKGLAWQAVEIPAILPKPDLLALTGGYRRTPVMQVGADIYCDTALICEVLDALAPTRRCIRRPRPRRRGSRQPGLMRRCSRVGDLCVPASRRCSMLGHLSPAQVQAFTADRKAMRGDTHALRMPREATRCCMKPSGNWKRSLRPGSSMWPGRHCRLPTSRCTTTFGLSGARCAGAVTGGFSALAGLVCAHEHLWPWPAARDRRRGRN